MSTITKRTLYVGGLEEQVGINRERVCWWSGRTGRWLKTDFYFYCILSENGTFLLKVNTDILRAAFVAFGEVQCPLLPFLPLARYKVSNANTHKRQNRPLFRKVF